VPDQCAQPLVQQVAQQYFSFHLKVSTSTAEGMAGTCTAYTAVHCWAAAAMIGSGLQLGSATDSLILIRICTRAVLHARLISITSSEAAGYTWHPYQQSSYDGGL
jgi:hypothetical protein